VLLGGSQPAGCQLASWQRRCVLTRQDTGNLTGKLPAGCSLLGRPSLAVGRL
jgi:hypothetical protein